MEHFSPYDNWSSIKKKNSPILLKVGSAFFMIEKNKKASNISNFFGSQRHPPLSALLFFESKSAGADHSYF